MLTSQLNQMPRDFVKLLLHMAYISMSKDQHKKGHTLDLIISRSDDELISECSVLPSLGSDHNLIDCLIDYAKPSPLRVRSTVRNFKKMNKIDFSNDLNAVVNALELRGTVDEMLQQLDSSVDGVLDARAPSQTRTRSLRPRFPWYNEEINDARRIRRKLERKWRKTKSEENHSAYLDQCHSVNKLIHTAKETYYKHELESSDNKNMYVILNNLLHNNVKSLPACDSVSDLCNSFAQFFNNKVAKIRGDLVKNSDVVQDVANPSDVNHNVVAFESFKPVDTEDIEKIVRSASNKSCVLDTLPMWLFKDNMEIMCQALKVIVNESFASGVFPSRLKEAIVCPVLKKSTLDKNVLQNYRPVSNIRYYSKIIEKIASIQLQDHLRAHGLQEEYQSAYRAQHSTETALLRVKTDILTEMDNGRAVFVVLLDLSAAFDTVDHQILLDCLSTNFNITGVALGWIRSYLLDRSFRVSTGGDLSVSEDAEGSGSTEPAVSKKVNLEYGVPQGSVLGPLFFVLYTNYIGHIIRRFGIKFHIYADDIQLYIPFDPKIASASRIALTKLTSCINEIYKWMTKNMLKLNNSKTEFFVAASTHNMKILQDVSLKIGDITIKPSSAIKNLGVIFDQAMSMESHVKSLVKTINFHLRNIYRIRRYITVDSCHHLVRSLVLSRLDYANSLLLGISAKDRKKLQSLQNRAARIIFRCNRFEPSAPLRRELHWLPVNERVIFKILLLTYKGVNNLAPGYVAELLTEYIPGRENMRSGNKHLLTVRRTNRQVGDSAFDIAGPRHWNSLPLHIRLSPSVSVFKKLLKTHLFPSI